MQSPGSRWGDRLWFSFCSSVSRWALLATSKVSLTFLSAPCVAQGGRPTPSWVNCLHRLYPLEHVLSSPGRSELALVRTALGWLQTSSARSWLRVRGGQRCSSQTGPELGPCCCLRCDTRSSTGSCGQSEEALLSFVGSPGSAEGQHVGHQHAAVREGTVLQKCLQPRSARAGREPFWASCTVSSVEGGGGEERTDYHTRITWFLQSSDLWNPTSFSLCFPYSTSAPGTRVSQERGSWKKCLVIQGIPSIRSLP